MKNWKKRILACTVTFLFSAGSFVSSAYAATLEVSNKEEVTLEASMKKGVNLLHTSLDSEGRAAGSYFIGNAANQEGKRVGTTPTPINLKNWKQQKLGDNYLWDRGHLVGNQFAGFASNSRSNLVGQTSYANQTLQVYYEGGMKSSDPNALDNWLESHPQNYLEYYVKPVFKNDEAYPRATVLEGRGLDKEGNPIRFAPKHPGTEGTGELQELPDGWNRVVLTNYYPGWVINYNTGTATKSNEPDNWKDLLPEELKAGFDKTIEKTTDTLINDSNENDQTINSEKQSLWIKLKKLFVMIIDGIKACLNFLLDLINVFN